MVIAQCHIYIYIYIYIYFFFGHTFVLTFFFPLHPQPDEVIHLARK